LLQSDAAASVQTLGAGPEAVSIFLEPLPAVARLFVIGGTDTAAALARIAKLLDLRVIVLDAREAYLARERFPDADEIHCGWPSDLLSRAKLDERSHVVALTHDSKIDVPALAAALRSPACYIGALGSRRTHARRRQSLAELGFGDADLARIRAPIGLDLGGRSPEEIAVSIASEMVANRYGRSSRAGLIEELAKGAA
jgi:xanthine dehydrogenase accessory factor